MSNDQTGFFKIPASALGSSEVIVPKDEAGEAPSGEDNPDQNAYDISTDGERHDYYIHIVDNLDVDVNWNIKQSHMFDEDLEDPVDIFDTDRTVSANGGTGAYSGDENGSYYGVSIDPNADPSSGELIVIIQKSSV